MYSLEVNDKSDLNSELKPLKQVSLLPVLHRVAGTFRPGGQAALLCSAVTRSECGGRLCTHRSAAVWLCCRGWLRVAGVSGCSAEPSPWACFSRSNTREPYGDTTRTDTPNMKTLRRVFKSKI